MCSYLSSGPTGQIQNSPSPPGAAQNPRAVLRSRGPRGCGSDGGGLGSAHGALPRPQLAAEGRGLPLDLHPTFWSIYSGVPLRRMFMSQIWLACYFRSSWSTREPNERYMELCKCPSFSFIFHKRLPAAPGRSRRRRRVWWRLSGWRRNFWTWSS